MLKTRAICTSSICLKFADLMKEDPASFKLPDNRVCVKRTRGENDWILPRLVW